MKFLIKYIYSLLIIALCTLSASCSNNYINDDDTNHNNGNNNSNSNNNNDSSNDIRKIISDNVSVSSYYADYAFYITLSTQLESKLPNYSIVYGIAMRYTEDAPNTVYKSDFTYKINNASCIHVDFNSSKTKYDIIASIFVDIGPYAEESLYWNSYMALKANGTMTNDQKNLYNSCVKYMNEVENEAKSQLETYIYAKIDGKEYTIAYIR